MNDNPQCSHIKEPLYKYVKDCYWGLFRGNTAILSSTCRQLALGIGGVLLIHNSFISGVWNKIILTLLVLFFIFDAAQYLNQSISFHKLAKHYDGKIKNDEIVDISKLEEPDDINKWTDRFFIIKLLILGLTSIIFVVLIWTS